MPKMAFHKGISPVPDHTLNMDAACVAHRLLSPFRWILAGVAHCFGGAARRRSSGGTQSRLIFAAIGLSFVARAFAGDAVIPVMTPGSAKPTAWLEASVYRPAGLGPFPVLILNHGAAGGSPKTSLPWKRDGAYWSERGYIVIAPMRRGRGESTGISPESEERNCRISDWFDALPQSLADLDAVVEFAQTLQGADAEAITLVGESRGGFLSVAYAAEGKYRSRIRSVVNFVGGWVVQAEDQCPQDFNSIAFERFGSQTKTRMLWLYGRDDRFYGNDAVHAYVQSFRRAGGVADFQLIDGIPENGHWLLEYPAKWRSLVDDFLRSTNAT